MMMSKAVSDHDWDAFQKYVDVDAVVTKVVDDTMAASLKKDTSGLGALAAGMAQSLRPSIIAAVKEAIHQQ